MDKRRHVEPPAHRSSTVPTLSDFAIVSRWPAQHPSRIQLYSLNTHNGVKTSIMLEKNGLPREAHLVDIMQGESHTPLPISQSLGGSTI